jgi:hypothetical protein
MQFSHWCVLFRTQAVITWGDEEGPAPFISLLQYVCDHTCLLQIILFLVGPMVAILVDLLHTLMPSTMATVRSGGTPFKYPHSTLSLPSSDPSTSNRPAGTDSSFDVWSLHLYPPNFLCMCSRVAIWISDDSFAELVLAGSLYSDMHLCRQHGMACCFNSVCYIT